MSRIHMVLAAALVCSASAPTSARAQVLPTSLEITFQNHLLRDALLPDSRFTRAESRTGVDHDALREYFHRSASGGYLSATPDRLYGIEAYEVSRLAVALEGAERVASAAMFISALGTTFAGWDEKSSLYFVGTAAAAGALWSTVEHGDDPRWRVRFRWEPEE